MRLSRKNNTIDYSSGRIGLLDVFDNAMLSLLRVTQDEYDKIVESISEEEIDVIIYEPKTFAEKRLLLNTINKLYLYL